MYLLDTNVCVQFLRNRHALVVKRINARNPNELRLCAPVVAELYYGCLRSVKMAANRSQVDAFLTPYKCLPFDSIAADIFSKIRYDLEIQGAVIGPYDMQIAAIALAQHLTLVTHNTSEFRRVPGLVSEDWEQP